MNQDTLEYCGYMIMETAKDMHSASISFVDLEDGMDPDKVGYVLFENLSLYDNFFICTIKPCTNKNEMVISFPEELVEENRMHYIPVTKHHTEKAVSFGSYKVHNPWIYERVVDAGYSWLYIV